MLIEDILRETNQQMETVVVMPGRFSPPHIGHMKAWKWLSQKFGDTYIATSDKVAPPRSPFNFNEKKTLLMHAGVPATQIVQVKNPYLANEIKEKYDPETTVIIFAVSEKDMAEDPRFTFKPKKDGSPSYFQPYDQNIDNLRPMSEHGYIATMPTFKFNVLGQPMKSATEFRANFAQADDRTQEKMIVDLYGKYSDNIHQLLKTKIV